MIEHFSFPNRAERVLAGKRTLAEETAAAAPPGEGISEIRRELQMLIAVVQAMAQEFAALQERLAGPQPPRDYYTTAEAAKLLGKRPFTVREWCRHGRVRCAKAPSGRGLDGEWRISRAELERIRNEGLLPLPRSR
jgi:hypothetical protein